MASESSPLLTNEARPHVPPLGQVGRSVTGGASLRQPGEPLPGLGGQLKEIWYSSYVNYMLIFVPLGICAEFLHWGDVAVFTLNFFAIVPLAKLLGFATEEIALRTSQAIGGLLNATFGNAVELIIGFLALRQGLLAVVQASILGSVLSNLLLVLGASFLLGGLKYTEQRFNSTAAGMSCSLMTMSVLGMILPAAFQAQISQGHHKRNDHILDISHYTAVVLLVVYALYLFFQLRTHAHLYADDEENGQAEGDEEGGEEGEGAEEPLISAWLAFTLLVTATLLVAICAEGLVGAIEGVSEKAGMGSIFVGFILLPLVGNAAEHLTAVTVALKNKMELSLGVALGSSIQISLLVGPLLVVSGWIIGQPLTLEFGIFETVTIFIAIFFTNGIVADGASNWLEGAMLLAGYLIIAVSHWYLPEPENGGGHKPPHNLTMF